MRWDMLYRQVCRSLCRNRVRTALTLLGMTIGIMATIVVFSAGEGVKGFVLGQLNVFGSNLIHTEIKVPAFKHESLENAMGQAMGITITTLKIEDAEAISRLPNVEFVSPGLTGQELISYRDEIKKTLLMGVGENDFKIFNVSLSAGRMFTREENLSLDKVAVLGEKVKEKLFGNEDPLGKEIKIRRANFKVIGVVERRGMAGFMDMDNIVFLPVKTLQKSILGVDHVIYIGASTKDESLIDDTAEEIRWLLRRRHNITDPSKEDFAITTMAQAINMVGTILNGMTILLLALVAISLLVGGIGIMNVMYVAVTERTFEIGLLKTLGASQRDILWQFLLEAVAITLIGGIAGVILGLLFSFVVYLIAQSQGFNLPISVSWPSIVLACGFSAAVGLIFGLMPARRAAQLEPVDALRQE